MTDHHFESRSERCLGCDIERSAVADAKLIPDCPSRMTIIGGTEPDFIGVLVAPDRVVIVSEAGVILRLDRARATQLKHLIGEFH